MKVLGIVPARMASTRFPRKPMSRIHGVPMVGHCYFRSLLSGSLDDVWIATCDQEIVDYAEAVGGRAVMTSDLHQRASDRAAEALALIEARLDATFSHVALIQGDEPMLAPEMLDELVEPARAAPDLPVVNLVARIASNEEFRDANTVKIVADRNGDALYFSREPIPSTAKFQGPVPMWKQLGMILFSREALLAYPTLEPTPLEIIESVDMNRFLEHGWPIRLAPTAHVSHAVDTPADLEAVTVLMASDAIRLRYTGKAEGGSETARPEGAP